MSSPSTSDALGVMMSNPSASPPPSSSSSGTTPSTVASSSKTNTYIALWDMDGTAIDAWVRSVPGFLHPVAAAPAAATASATDNIAESTEASQGAFVLIEERK